MSIAERAAFAAGSFLAELGEHERESLYEIGLRRSFPRGAALMLQDDPDDRVMALLAGRVKVARMEQDGRDLVLEIRAPGRPAG
jgi:CRP-like cAMP-binding protein